MRLLPVLNQTTMDFLVGIVGDGFTLVASDCGQARSIVMMKKGNHGCIPLGLAEFLTTSLLTLSFRHGQDDSALRPHDHASIWIRCASHDAGWVLIFRQSVTQRTSESSLRRTSSFRNCKMVTMSATFHSADHILRRCRL